MYQPQIGNIQFHQAHAEDMESPEDALRQAQAAEVEGDLILAESLLRTASKRWKREPEFKMRHARVLRAIGQERKALKVYRAVLKAHPQRADAAMGAAQTATSLNKLKLAESLWSRALSVGVQADVATEGLCRTIWTRGRKEESWERAKVAFVQGGSSSRILHDFLRECAPIIGTSVPEIDLLETGQLDTDFTPIESRRELNLKPATFSGDSVEAMAGMSATDLSAPANQEVTELLGLNETRPQVDMSALQGGPKPAETTTGAVIPDDLLDFD